MLSIEEYQALVSAAHATDHSNASALELLRKQLDERLSVLRSPDAGDRLRAVSNSVTSHGIEKADNRF